LIWVFLLVLTAKRLLQYIFFVCCGALLGYFCFILCLGVVAEMRQAQLWVWGCLLF
jgi:hypothetical protein